MLSEYTFDCAIEVAAPAAKTARPNSVFVLMFLCVYVAVCEGTMTKGIRFVNSFFAFFLNVFQIPKCRNPVRCLSNLQKQVLSRQMKTGKERQTRKKGEEK